MRECLVISQRLNEEAKKRQSASSHTDTASWRAISVDAIDENVVENVVNFAACCISPIAAFLGGVVAQEIVKFTGKFLPLHQWLYFDAFEVVPPSTSPLTGTIFP